MREMDSPLWLLAPHSMGASTRLRRSLLCSATFLNSGAVCVERSHQTREIMAESWHLFGLKEAAAWHSN